MLSKATYAGRICLSCRYQLRISRPQPLPAATRFPRLGLPRYTTSANGDTDTKAKLSERKADDSTDSADKSLQDGTAPGPGAAGVSADTVRSSEEKPAGSSAETIFAPDTEPSEPFTGAAPAPDAGPEGPLSETKRTELETEVSSEFDLAWTKLDKLSQAQNQNSSQHQTPSQHQAHPQHQAHSQHQERGSRLRVGRNDVNVETASLGMKILGKEGHTIVLRDREYARKEPTVLEEEAAKGFDIEGTLEEQGREITNEETRRNIDELRPHDTRDLLRREFDQIKNTLMEGVTISQMEDYICHFMGGPKGGEDMIEDEAKDLLRRLTGHKRAQVTWPVRPRYWWISEQLSWKPPKNYSWGTTMKEKLALAIMRACWHLQVMEDTPYIGEVKVTVDPQILNLLLVENKTWRTIQNSLGDGASIKIVPEAKKMQIIASRSKCDSALHQVDQFVSRIKQGTIPLSHLGPVRLSDGILEHLSSVTGAHIAYNGTQGGSAPTLTKKGGPTVPNQDNSDAIRVTWSQSADRPDTAESLKHVIFRLLLSATSPGNTKGAVKTVLDKEDKTKPEELALVRQHGDNHDLPWNLRPRTWARLVQLAQSKPSQSKREDAASEGAPEETSVPPQDEAGPAPEFQGSPEPADAVKQNGTISARALRFPLLRPDEKPQVKGWLPNFTRTSSLFGHVLHPLHGAAQHGFLDHRRPVDPSSVALRPVSPSVSALTNLAAEASASVSTSLLIRLLPKEGPAPALELHLDLPEEDGPLTWETTGKKLVAVRYNWASHVRLPLHPVDVSVRQSLATEMDALALYSSAPLREFFENSKLDLQSDLVTPPSLTLRLPSAFLSREGDAQEEAHSEGVEGDTQGEAGLKGRQGAAQGEANIRGREGDALEEAFFMGVDRDAQPYKKGREAHAKEEGHVMDLDGEAQEEAHFLGLDGDTQEKANSMHLGTQQGDAQDVDYHFMGLELRTTTTVPFRSGRLSLTSVEAGQQGRRVELAFEPGDVPPSEARHYAKTYLEEVLRVAEGRYFPWVGSRPLEVASIEDSV